MNRKLERHPFTPFLPEGCKVVLCGTFPPKPEKWSMDFFYPNFQNDMWRIFGWIFYNEKEHFFDRSNKTIDKEGIKRMLSSHKIGVGETATEVIRTRDNASDKFLEIITPVDINSLFEKAPDCQILATTGEKAASVIAALTETDIPKMGERKSCQFGFDNGEKKEFLHWRLPSTSRAYPMPLEKKKSYYEALLRYVGIIE